MDECCDDSLASSYDQEVAFKFGSDQIKEDQQEEDKEDAEYRDDDEEEDDDASYDYNSCDDADVKAYKQFKLNRFQ